MPSWRDGWRARRQLISDRSYYERRGVKRKMKIRFRMEREHMQLLSDYVQGLPALQAAHSKRRMITCLYFLTVGILGEISFLLLTGRFFGLLALGCLFIAVIFWFAFPLITRSTASKFTNQLYANPKFSWVFGERTIELFDDGFEYTTTSSVGKNKWETISNCGFIDDAFVFIIGPTTGFVIKQDQVIEGDFSAFASEVMRRTETS